jgi:hypothetical protein
MTSCSGRAIRAWLVARRRGRPGPPSSRWPTTPCALTPDLGMPPRLLSGVLKVLSPRGRLVVASPVAQRQPQKRTLCIPPTMKRQIRRASMRHGCPAQRERMGTEVRGLLPAPKRRHPLPPRWQQPPGPFQQRATLRRQWLVLHWKMLVLYRTSATRASRPPGLPRRPPLPTHQREQEACPRRPHMVTG